MGLSISVGLLADLAENDAEGAEWLTSEFASVNEILAANNLPPHQEPRDCEVLSADMYGYAGLHYLRRLAAHLEINKKLPEPGDEQSSEDPVLEKYFESFDGERRGFDHLILHSDAEGFYLPQDFADVLFQQDGMEVAGGMIGSSPRLMQECERIAKELELPLDTDADSDELFDATENQGQKNEKRYLSYAIESFSLLNLYKSCQHSIKTGAAVVFG